MATSHRAPSGARGRRNRRVPLVWLACVVAALLLTLGVSGTLSSWTSAVITDGTNTAATGRAVILRQVQGGSACLSSSTTDNTSTCATVNDYGGTATPLTPGTGQVTTVTFTNVGSANASSFELAPAACSQAPAAGSGTPAAADLCTSRELTVAVSCSPGSGYDAAAAWTDLTYAAGAPPAATRTHAAASGDLDAGGSWTCQFTVALAASTGVDAQGITVSQPLTWRLTA